VSSLLLQRAVTRRQDTAVRAALGAGRSRLVRQFLLESLALALAGGTLGIGLAWAAIRAMMALRPADLTALQIVRLDGSVIAVALGVSVVVGIVFGIAPALHGARARATAVLGRAPRAGDGTSARFRWALVSAEVALCFALLVGASLVIGSLRQMASRDPGFRPEGLIVMDVRLPSWRYGNAAARNDLLAGLIERMQQLPAVERVTAATGVPPAAGIRFGRLEVTGRAPDEEGTLFFGGEVGAGFLDLLGQPIVSGRDFLPEDMQADPVPVVLGEAAARRVFPEGDAVGRTFRMEGRNHTVIGVARDIRITGLGDDGTTLAGYWPMPGVRSEFNLLLRVGSDDPALPAMLRDMVRAAEPDALVSVARMQELLRSTIARQRFTTSLLTTFALLALLLAAVGLYGVLAHVVSGRTHEIGVRVALGASARRVRMLVLRSGMSATFAGLAAGCGVAVIGLRLLGSELFGLDQNRTGAWLVAAAVVSMVALAASWLPAQRAAGIDPVRAMRGD
jgi:predicted permease